MAETVRFHEPDEVLVPGELPVLPLQDTVLFPGTASTLSVGNPRSLRLLDEVAEGNRQLATVLVRRRTPEPSPEDLHAVGTAAEITRLVRLPDGTAQVVLQGIARVRLTDFVRTEPYLLARVEPIRPFVEITLEVEALQRNVLDLFRRLVALAPELPDELATAAANIRTPDRLADAVAAVLNVPAEVKQEILETANVPDRLRHITRLLTREIEVLETARKIQADVRAQVERGQREYYLREQLRAIQRELGQLDEREAEINELRRAIEEAGMPQEARREAERELDRLARMPPAAPEQGPEFVPGWFLGLEDKAQEAPDWFQRLDLTSGPLAEVPPSTEPEVPIPAEPEVPDWFRAAPLPEGVDWAMLGTVSPPEPAEPGQGAVPDWLDTSATASDRILPAEDIPFPELDLEQVPPLPAAPAEEEEVEILRIPYEVERKQIERVRRVRAERDARRAEHALERLREAARSEDENLMWPLLDCARAHCTEGEIGRASCRERV